MPKVRSKAKSKTKAVIRAIAGSDPVYLHRHCCCWAKMRPSTTSFMPVSAQR